MTSTPDPRLPAQASAPLTNVYAKLQVHSKTEAVAKALLERLL